MEVELKETKQMVEVSLKVKAFMLHIVSVPNSHFSLSSYYAWVASDILTKVGRLERDSNCPQAVITTKRNRSKTRLPSRTK